MGHISNPVLCQRDGEGWGQPQSEVITGQWPGGCDAGTKTEGFLPSNKVGRENLLFKKPPVLLPTNTFFFKKLKIMKDVKYSGKRRKKMLSRFYSNFCFKQ